MTKVCRLCLSKLQRGSKYFNVNAVESFTGFMPYRDQLTTFIPEMAIDMIPNPVICNYCRTALKFAYDFKIKCLLVERKVREYAEGKPSDVALDLNDISSSDLPVLEKPKAPPTESVEPSNQASLLSALLLVKKEEVLPPLVLPRKTPPKPVFQQNAEGNNAGPYMCSICDMKFNNLQALKFHKQQLHEEDYMCNFCSASFKSLQYLRKHNNVCQKSRNPAGPNPVLTKRPHLPTKAKNHLKRWLFRHTDHPYPTDLEKQQLMKETNLSLLQVENWFINARRRILADLTKLKNLRGLQIQRKRGLEKLELGELGEEILEADAERLLEEFDTSFEETLMNLPSVSPLISKRGPKKPRIEYATAIPLDPLALEEADIDEADLAADAIKLEDHHPEDESQEESREENDKIVKEDTHIDRIITPMQVTQKKEEDDIDTSIANIKVEQEEA